LTNTKPVAGLQTVILATAADESTRADPFLHPTSVKPVGRAAGFQLGWTADRSQANIILYSTSGAVIPQGDGPVVQICYSVAPETPPQTLFLWNIDTIVADPTGEALPACPTFARLGSGRICVGSPACDVNGDGVSDVLDVIRQVRCVLATPGDSAAACPDSIAARADCNADGSVDIRDVICCVRKIVGLTRPTGTIPPSEIGIPQGSSINFEGPAYWTSATEGVAKIRIDAPQDWGGMEFSIDPAGTPIRIGGMALEGGRAPQGTMIESATDASGVAHAMLFNIGSGARPASSIGVIVNLIRTAPGTGSNSIRLINLKSGTASGTATTVSSYAPVLQLVNPSIAAAALFKARPNPFAAQTEISFVLPIDASASLRIYDIQGRLVRSLIQGPTTAGVHRVSWDGRDDRGKAARSGIYFTKLIVGATSRTERIMLLR